MSCCFDCGNIFLAFLKENIELEIESSAVGGCLVSGSFFCWNISLSSSILSVFGYFPCLLISSMCWVVLTVTTYFGLFYREHQIGDWVECCWWLSGGCLIPDYLFVEIIMYVHLFCVYLIIPLVTNVIQCFHTFMMPWNYHNIWFTY